MKERLKACERAPKHLTIYTRLSGHLLRIYSVVAHRPRADLTCSTEQPAACEEGVHPQRKFDMWRRLSSTQVTDNDICLELLNTKYM